jgi:hypothetical protein
MPTQTPAWQDLPGGHAGNANRSDDATDPGARSDQLRAVTDGGQS